MVASISLFFPEGKQGNAGIVHGIRRCALHLSPRAAAASDAHREEYTAHAMDPSEVKVLVVEDDEFTRMATIDILKSCRYHVEAVENGQEALDLLQSNHGRYDLVLCDVMLPVMTGIELLDELQKQTSTLSHVPVVMTSSNEEMDVVTSCLSKGAKDYLIKPIQVNTAKTLVRHVWLSRRLERPSSQSVWRDLDVIRTIGKGTHGTVVLARRRVDGAVVAVKRVRISMISESGRKQADNEVILLKSLYHVNIVRFYDQFMAEDELNIVMEYADGGNLRQLVKLRAREKLGPFPESVIMCWFSQLVLAVAYIHGKNVLHRDLKAQNVFLTRKNVVKLGDFGISKALAGDDTANTACGTPESMSPEICRGEPYGKKSDIWSLGCILYEMIMCKRPFEAATLPEIFTKICKGDYPPIAPTFSRELRLLVHLMLQQDASKRPSIEDICRFPVVQAPIQAFLSEHVAEFQEALELEAKLHQPSLYSIKPPPKDPLRSPVGPAPRSAPTKLSTSPGSQQSTAPPRSEVSRQGINAAAAAIEAGKIRNSAIAAAAVGLSIDAPPSLTHVANVVEYSKIGSASSSTLDDSLGDELRSKVDIADIRAGVFTTYVSCVSAFDLCYALKKHFNKTEVEAEEALADLIKLKVVKYVAAENLSSPDLTRGDTYLRFQVDELFVPLNMKHINIEHVQQAPMDVCLLVRQMASDLHNVPSFPRGISTGFRTPTALPNENVESAEFNAPLTRLYRKFLKLVARLQTIDVAALPKHERQAFFINVYNTMVLHGLIEFGVPQNAGQYRSFEKDVTYMIGGLVFTLGDIKHGILRCNRKPPANYWERQLQANDPKLHYRLHIRDPRSLLVLMDHSDPLASPDQIPILKPGRTDTDLEEQVEKYCARHIEINSTAMELVLPRLFRNFRDDFGASEADMLSWLSQYMEDAPPEMIQYRVRYLNGISS